MAGTPSSVARSSSAARGPQHRVVQSRALYDTLAIITRTGARLSPGVRELLTDLEAHMRAVADAFDRSR
jgi:hypothetical protein